MTAAERPVGEDDLTALVDGRLPPDRRAMVESFLAERPELVAQVRLDREARSRLRDRLRPKAEEPVPTRLRVAALMAERRVLRRRLGTWAMAACLLLSIGATGGWVARDRLAPPNAAGSAPWAVVAREALAAHRTFAVEIAHPVEVKAAEEAHLTKWLSKRLGRRLVVPDLDEVGFHLIGGRLLPAGRDVAAQLMYGDDTGQRLTVYVRVGETGESALRYMKEGDLSSFSWINDGLGYAVSAGLDKERLLGVTRAISRDVDEGRRGSNL